MAQCKNIGLTCARHKTRMNLLYCFQHWHFNSFSMSSSREGFGFSKNSNSASAGGGKLEEDKPRGGRDKQDQEHLCLHCSSREWAITHLLPGNPDKREKALSRSCRLACLIYLLTLKENTSLGQCLVFCVSLGFLSYTLEQQLLLEVLQHEREP